MEPTDELKPAPISRGAIAALSRFARRPPPTERCELCAAPLAENHQHLLEPATHQIACACDACAILFSTVQNGKYRRVPRRIEHLQNFQMSDERWAGLGVPIALAFFVHDSSAEQMLTIYPSPAGGTHAALPAEAWDELSVDNPVLKHLESDVEALLVNRMGGSRDYFRVPIDECYKLIGIIRTQWRGLSGGVDLWKQVAEFFEQLKKRSVKAKEYA